MSSAYSFTANKRSPEGFARRARLPGDRRQYRLSDALTTRHVQRYEATQYAYGSNAQFGRINQYPAEKALLEYSIGPQGIKE